jgi:acetyltransferase EpsM
VADTVREINRVAGTGDPVYNIAGFIDDDESKWGEVVNDIEVKGGDGWLRDLASGGEKPRAVMALGEPKTKRIIAQKLEGAVEWVTVVHPAAIISPYSTIGSGTVIQANVFVGPNVRIGKHCCFNFCSSVGHDAMLGDYVSVMSHCDITGYDVVKDGAYVATSVSIIPGVTVGEDAFVGAGSVVVKNVPQGARVLGYPAKRMNL